MNKIALATFSYFDVGNKLSEYVELEHFYHGFVLGLMVGERGNRPIPRWIPSGIGLFLNQMKPFFYVLFVFSSKWNGVFSNLYYEC